MLWIVALIISTLNYTASPTQRVDALPKKNSGPMSLQGALLHQSRKSVGILVIGNEILRGTTLDTNSNYLCRKAFNYGLEVREITVIPDEKATIGSLARRMASSYDYVFTSGGIG